MKQNRKIYVKNLQGKGGWHYNIILYPEKNYGLLSESQAEEKPERQIN